MKWTQSSSHTVGSYQEHSEDASNDDQIPIPNAKSVILKKVFEFCACFKDSALPVIEKPLKSANLKDVVAPWNAEVY